MHMADYETLQRRAKHMRENPTKSERLFRKRLTGANIVFKTQVILEPYIVDFLIGGLIVEIDGSVHHSDDAKKYDQRRDAQLRAAGFRILRIPNDKVRTIDLNRFKPSYLKKAKQKAQKRAERNLRKAEQKAAEAVRLKVVAERNNKPRLVKKTDTQPDTTRETQD